MEMQDLYAKLGVGDFVQLMYLDGPDAKVTSLRGTVIIMDSEEIRVAIPYGHLSLHIAHITRIAEEGHAKRIYTSMVRNCYVILPHVVSGDHRAVLMHMLRYEIRSSLEDGHTKVVALFRYILSQVIDHGDLYDSVSMTINAHKAEFNWMELRMFTRWLTRIDELLIYSDKSELTAIYEYLFHSQEER